MGWLINTLVSTFTMWISPFLFVADHPPVPVVYGVRVHQEKKHPGLQSNFFASFLEQSDH